MAIQGKVAAILNSRDLVINKGANDDVSEGMLFQVTEPNVLIEDPDSGVALGVLARDKIRVRVFEVHPQFSLAKTYETYSAREPSTFERTMANVVSTTGRTVTRVRKIIMEPEGQKTVTIGVEGSTVNIGDPAVQIAE
jgi:hypothetical protein